MIILLEGADCTGKTTLALQIQDQISAKYWHFGPTDAPNHLPSLLQMAEEGGHHVIDRMHWSELIYGRIMRDGPIYEGRTLRRHIAALGVVTIYCVRYDLEKHFQHFQTVRAIRDEYVDEDQFMQIAGLYHGLWFGNALLEDIDSSDLVAVLTRDAPLMYQRGHFGYSLDEHEPQQFLDLIERVAAHD